MAVTDKALDLIQLLKTRRDGITRKALQNRWRCSAVTVYRTVDKAKTILGAPISFDATKAKYYCSKDESIEAPGLWFRPDELAALLGLSHWLESIGPGVLSHQLEPIQRKLEMMLESQSIRVSDWKDRIRLLPMASRQMQHGILVASAEAVLRRARTCFKYKGVRDADFIERMVSPQTLVPIAATGYVAQEIFDEISADFKKHYPDAEWIIPFISELSTASATHESILKTLIVMVRKIKE